jgi:hypothetical protein
MGSVIRSPKELWLGLIYASIGAVGFWFALDLPFGSSARMGAGYFPTIISALLLLFGIVSVARAFLLNGEAVGAIAGKALPLIIGSVVVFALLIEKAGLIVAGVALLLLCAFASSEFRFRWIALISAVALVVCCALLFIKGLGLPMPAIGPWLKAILSISAGA